MHWCLVLLIALICGFVYFAIGGFIACLFMPVEENEYWVDGIFRTLGAIFWPFYLLVELIAVCIYGPFKVGERLLKKLKGE